MANYQDIRSIAIRQLRNVTASPESWKSFLSTAAIAYNYNFPNQLLIHAQSPTASAVADIQYWNQQAGRYVKRGAHGIAILDTRSRKPRLRYLFDLSDTVPVHENPQALPWVVTDQNWRPVWDTLIQEQQADSIQSALLMMATTHTAERSPLFLQALSQSIDGSSLQWAKPEEQQRIFTQLVTQSVLYMAALRCGVDAERLDLSGFDNVSQFDTTRLALCLGGACQQASRPLFQFLGAMVREIDSVARNDKLRYYESERKPTETTKEADRGVQQRERVSDSQPDTERGAGGSRQVRQSAPPVPDGAGPVSVRPDADGRDALPPSAGSGPQRPGTDGADHAGADAPKQRTELSDQSTGMGAVDEQPETSGGGAGDGTDLQPVTPVPQAESEQSPSAFSVPVSDLPPVDAESLFHLLGDESSSRPTNAEILTYFDEHKDHAERCQFLKSGYQNVYTYLQVEGRYIGYHAAGEFLEIWEGNYLTKTAQNYLTWDAVSQRIAALMEAGQFLVPIKQPPAPEIQQLTLTDEQEIELGLPNEASQQRQIETVRGHETVMDASGKYITESDITDVLKRGSVFSNGKYRIQRHFSEPNQNTQAESIAFLKKEFGTGGFSWILANETHGFVDFNASGYTLTSYGEKCHYTRKLRWPEVAKRLQLLIHNNQYLTDKEKDGYKVWLEQEQAKQNVVTPEKPSVEVPPPQAPAPDARPVGPGDTVYLENDSAFTVESIGWADVQLRDESFPLISRAINREEFSRLMQANPKNNRFLPPEPAAGEEITDSGEPSTSLLEQVGVPDPSELPHEPINYAAPADSDIPSAPREKYAANVAAIRLLKGIEQRVANGGPPANAEEQEVLARYTGWGGLPDVFDPEKSAWSREYTQLKELLTETEYTDARSSTLTAFYTPPEIIRAMYRALERFGVRQGNILEPSMGVGAFFANAPESFSVNHAHLYGVELDALTGRLAKQLYQNARIQITGFEQASLPDNFFDCVVGNVPFGDFQVNDPKYNRLHFQIHDFFFGKPDCSWIPRRHQTGGAKNPQRCRGRRNHQNPYAGGRGRKGGLFPHPDGNHLHRKRASRSGAARPAGSCHESGESCTGGALSGA